MELVLCIQAALYSTPTSEISSNNKHDGALKIRKHTGKTEQTVARNSPDKFIAGFSSLPKQMPE
jgi:hypothetical protein